jgi:glycosyltransferase involved in cell wall biosynthesis
MTRVLADRDHPRWPTPDDAGPNPNEPKVTIGIPVYNGARFLADAIAAVSAQTYQNLQIIICDNASTDGTQAICERFAQIDPRIAYIRQARNVGAAANFNHCVTLATGKYFKWAAHDDLIAPSFVERCVDALERDPDAVLCQSQVKIIDANGVWLATHDPSLFGTTSPDRIARLGGRLTTAWCKEVFGLIRRHVLLQSVLIGGYPASDEVLLAELALRGRFVILPEPLFSNREHPGRSTRGARLDHASLERQRWFKPELPSKPMLPTRTLYAAHLHVIHRQVTGRSDRLRCYAHLLRSLANVRLINLLTEPLIVREPKLAPVINALIAKIRRLRRPRPLTTPALERD